ncbi:RecX family transcriptional regulator [Paenibacillus sp. P96]|uniref:Regulatory protein RecX n=1 Tax=Paenibacillus zeirhizosphaerae TaxID=2987519 RepID=A0ABT9FRW2_9BACL|nr:RecX family transcriptional regulator [Paenibacillus sp. P96]MDP4097469.1 RecX family transcriptional regulator [Paenibacillus sp. P96]
MKHEPIEEEHNIQQGIGHFPAGVELEITKVEQGKRGMRGRYIIYFGPYSLSVLEDVMIKYRMTKGSFFNKSELSDIIIADERQRAYVLSLQYLARKPRTRQELSRRLGEKELEPAVIDETLDRLEKEKLVDDELYARQWARQRISGQSKGKLWIRQELRQKGVDKLVIAEALGEISETEEWESALQAGQKKWKQMRGEVIEKKRKTYSFLIRRGYSSEVTRRVLQSLLRNDQAGLEAEEDEMFWD